MKKNNLHLFFFVAVISLVTIGITINNIKTRQERRTIAAVFNPTPSFNDFYLLVYGLRPVDYWEGKFLESWQDTTSEVPEQEYVINYKRSISNDSWQYYALAPAVDANVTMFQATGKTQYLDRALFYINNVINSAQISSSIPTSQFKDSYLGWANHSHPELLDDGKEYPLFETFLWRYVASLLRIMKENNSVYNNPAYRVQYDTILSFTEKNIYEKWASSGRGGLNANIYRVNTHMTSHWARICLNLYLVTENQFRKLDYWQIYDNINNHLPNFNMIDSSPASMRKQIMPNPVDPSAYWWSSEWGDTSLPGQDVGHGNAVISYIVESHELDTTWTKADITGLINLFDKVVWPSVNDFRYYFDGSGSNDGTFAMGFMTLGRYSAALQKRLEDYTADIAVGRPTELFAHLALNVKYLSDKGSYLTPTPTSVPTPTPDIIFPVITSVQARNISSSGARITWKTDEASDTKVVYGLSITNLDLAVSSTAMSTAHAVSLSGLKRRTTYYYKVISKDASGNQASSRIYYFKTLK